MNAKTVRDSQVEMRMLVMPNDTNPIQTIFGGVVMGWVDMAAAMVASRHANKPVVTVHISDLSFNAPIRVGEQCLIYASLNYVGQTSMLVGVKVYAENPITSHTCHTTTAYLVLVAVDNQQKPIPVPPLKLETEEDERRYQEGKQLIDLLKEKKKNKGQK